MTSQLLYVAALSALIGFILGIAYTKWAIRALWKEKKQ